MAKRLRWVISRDFALVLPPSSDRFLSFHKTPSKIWATNSTIAFFVHATFRRKTWVNQIEAHFSRSKITFGARVNLKAPWQSRIRNLMCKSYLSIPVFNKSFLSWNGFVWNDECSQNRRRALRLVIIMAFRSQHDLEQMTRNRYLIRSNHLQFRNNYWQ